MRNSLERFGLCPVEIRIPNKTIDLMRWAVVACDQYTSERTYWEKVARFVGQAPSTLHLILPECYLEERDVQSRIRVIHETMRRYEAEGVFRAVPGGAVLVERSLHSGGTRKGLLIGVDLEQYSHTRPDDCLVRPTEATIVERIPPRMRIRNGALLELPHIILLVDDCEGRIIEPLHATKTSQDLLYDTPLMFDSGRVRGHAARDLAGLEAALNDLAGQERLRRDGRGQPMLFAVGDGNHSLATAKAVWDSMKETLSPSGREEHPARYALAEIVNLYDEGLTFEPIHRVLFNIDPVRLVMALENSLGRRFTRVGNQDELERIMRDRAPARDEERGEERVGVLHAGGSFVAQVPKPARGIIAAAVQSVLDSFIADSPGSIIDYIHGERTVRELGAKPSSAGIFLPAMDKRDFFGAVIRDGTLPRKAFSLGHADDKRFYFEARKITRWYDAH